METSREYYDRIMSDYREKRGRRSLRKYCQDEGVDYQWLMRSRKEYSSPERPEECQLPGTAERFIPLEVSGPSADALPSEWTISSLVLSGPSGEVSISAGTIASVVDLLDRLSEEGRS